MSVSSRLLAYSETWMIFQNNPIFGIGFDQVRSSVVFPSENSFLRILITYGLFGLFLYVVFLIDMLKQSLLLWRSDKQSLYLLFSLVLLLMSFTNEFYLIPINIIFFAFLRCRYLQSVGA